MKSKYLHYSLFIGFYLLFISSVSGQVLTYEGFDYFNNSDVALHQINNGKFTGSTVTNWDKSLGWAGDWREAGGTSTYAIKTQVSATYPSASINTGNYDLITSGHYLGSGTSTSVGRKIQNSPAGPFGKNGSNSSSTNTSNGTNYLKVSGNYTANNYTSTTTSIGADGTTLWMSFLLFKSENNDNISYISLHNNDGNLFDGNTGNHIAVGYFGAASNLAGIRYWSLRINNVVTRCAPLATNEWTLLVAKIQFKSNNTTANAVTLYINPTNIGRNATPIAVLTGAASSAVGADNSFRNIAYYGGGVSSGTRQSFLDEIRIANNYKAVTNASNLIRVEGEVCGGTLGNNVFTNGNFDQYSTTPNTYLADDAPEVPNPARRSIRNNGPWVDVTGGSYCYNGDIRTFGNGGPNDGYYSIVNGVRNAWDVWVTSSDYSGSGYLMLANAAYQPGFFFEQTQSGTFCEQTTYEFSVQVKNVDLPAYLTAYNRTGTSTGGFQDCDPTREPGAEQLSQLDAGSSGNRNLTQHEQSAATGCNLYDWYISGTVSATTANSKSYRVLPDIEFVIGDGSGNDVVAYSPPAPIPNDGLWHKVGFTFTTKPGVTTLELKVRNKAPGGGGNDIALDDFSFRACGPTVSLNMNNFPACTPATVSSSTGSGYVGPNWSAPSYRWQKKSTIGGWVTIPNSANTSSYTAKYPDILQGDSIRVNIASSASNLGNYNCSVLSNGGLINCTAPLPVTLLSFNAQKITTGVQLNWQTSYEKNSDYFTVERSVDGNTFTSVCQVSAKGNSSQLETYYCYDYSPATGKNYYRLKQVDLDGQFVYSKVVTLTYDQLYSNQIGLVPNPAKDVVNVTFSHPFEADQQVMIQLTTLTGQLLQQQNQKVNSQTRNISVSTANLAEGMYIVEVITENQKYVQKLIVKK